MLSLCGALDQMWLFRDIDDVLFHPYIIPIGITMYGYLTEDWLMWSSYFIYFGGYLM